jgi:hypothetical protein
MNANTKLQNANCKMQIANRGCRRGRRFAFCNDHFAFCILRPRRGITLTEVLISLGILTIGLLGAMAMFPVGSYYMLRTDNADRGAAIAQSVMSDLQAKGKLNPQAWYVMTPNPQGPVGTANQRFNTIDGKYTPNRAPVAATFTRPFAEAMAEGLRLSTNPVTTTRQFGSAYDIDPMYATIALLPTNSGSNLTGVAYPFPATAFMYPVTGPYYGAPQWGPWRVPGRNSTERAWPIRRVTFQQSSGWPFDATLAEHYFRGNDDLAIDLPERDDRPAQQRWDAADGEPLARQWVGDYSWIVTVVPTSRTARDGMARNPESYAYDVSVVVFYKRVLPSTAPLTPGEM